MLTNTLTLGNTFINANNEIVVFYQIKEGNIVSIITQEKIINLSQSDFTN